MHHSGTLEHNILNCSFWVDSEQMLAWNPASSWTLTEVLRGEDKRELPYRVQYTVRDERKPESLTKKTNTNSLRVLKTEVFELLLENLMFTFLEYKFHFKNPYSDFSATSCQKDLRCFIFVWGSQHLLWEQVSGSCMYDNYLLKLDKSHLFHLGLMHKKEYIINLRILHCCKIHLNLLSKSDLKWVAHTYLTNVCGTTWKTG